MIKINALSFQDLQLIYLLGEEKNLTRVAEKMFLSQPAASQRIKIIRDKTGLSVAVRNGKRWEMTEEGKELIRLYERLIKYQRETEIRINDLLNVPQGRLIIGTSDTLGIHLLPKPLSEFSKIYPQIHIEVTSKPSRTISKGLSLGTIDVGIALASAAQADFEKVKLFVRKDTLIIPPNHPLRGKEKCRKSDLSGLPLILLDQSSQSRSVIENWFIKENIELKHVMEMGSIELIKKYVAEGFGAGIVPRLSIANELSRRIIKSLELPATYPAQDIVVFTAGKRYQKKINRLFIDFIREYFSNIRTG